MKGKVQGTRDKGQGTRDKGQGKTEMVGWRGGDWFGVCELVGIPG
jgi:hypothetical protein